MAKQIIQKQRHSIQIKLACIHYYSQKKPLLKSNLIVQVKNTDKWVNNI